MEQHVAGEFAGGRVDRTGGADRVDVAERHPLDLLLCAVAVGEVVVLLHPVDGEVGPLHAEGPEDALLDELLPGLAADPFSDHAGGEEHQVLVLVLAPERGGRLQVVETGQKLRAALACGQPVQVVPGQARAVAQQVDGGHLLRRHRVVEVELGEHGTDRRVPGEGAFVDVHGQQGGGEGLRVRADGEERVRRRGELLLDVAPAVALRVDDLAVFDDRDAEAGDLPLGHDGFDPGVEAVEAGVGGLGGEGGGEGEGEGDDCEERCVGRAAAAV